MSKGKRQMAKVELKNRANVAISSLVPKLYFGVFKLPQYIVFIAILSVPTEYSNQNDTALQRQGLWSDNLTWLCYPSEVG